MLPHLCAGRLPSVMSYVKISYKPDGVWTIADKTGRYQTL